MTAASRRRLAPVKRGAAYAQLWRLVDGAVQDAFTCHPDYLTRKGRHMDTARRSIAKRVTGALLGFVEQTEGRRKPAERAEPLFFGEAQGREAANFAPSEAGRHPHPTTGGPWQGARP